MLGRGLQQHEAYSMTSNKGEINWRTKPGEDTYPADKAVDSHFASLLGRCEPDVLCSCCRVRRRGVCRPAPLSQGTAAGDGGRALCCSLRWVHLGPTANVDEDFHLVVGWLARSSCSESIKAFGKRFEEATAEGCPAL